MVTGPESSGKSTLAQALGRHLKWTVVPEYARTYLEGIAGKPYSRKDFDKIVAGQFNAERIAEMNTRQPLICDTSVVVLHIWHLEKWGNVHPLVQERLKSVEQTYFLLCQPDIPWVYDPLREHPEERELLYRQYKSVLKSCGFHYAEIGGTLSHRLEMASFHIKKWMEGLD